MKITRILAIPFTIVADVATLGNMGRGSFTGRLFDAERYEQRCKAEEDALRALCELIEAIKD